MVSHRHKYRQEAKGGSLTAERSPHVRLDIQGLRMVAVTLVVLNHVFGWPRGGFVGVDVFFVISGFLITGILLRDAEKHGHVSFIDFYRRRIRRIVPAATLTLAAIAATAAVMFSRARAENTWWDSVAAFFFVSNWRFAATGTDYFTAEGPLSPVRHFWSLSVEEQFYFAWPAILAAVLLLTARKAVPNTARRVIAGAIISILITASFTWAIMDTESDPTWSYFSTLTRAWELGFGALVAIVAPQMSRIPEHLRPALSWLGLGTIAFSALWVTEEVGFPGPWAILPVLGSALVLIAGAGTAEPVKWIQPITNSGSVIVGNLSYSIYLWHWPVIIFVGVYIEPNRVPFYFAALGITAALATLAYYFVEQPILNSSWLKPRNEQAWRPVRRRSDSAFDWAMRSASARFTFTATPLRGKAALVSCLFLVVGLGALVTVPREVPSYVSVASVDATGVDGAETLPPALGVLQEGIKNAARAQTWPNFDPPMDSVIGGPETAGELEACGDGITTDCWFGSESAPRTLVLTGDSIAVSYLLPLKAFVDSSGGQWRLLSQASNSCPFANVAVESADAAIGEACPARKQHVIDNINRLRPTAVIVANTYAERSNASTGQELSPQDWQRATREILATFSGSVGSVALLTPPPADKTPSECFLPGSSPADCVGTLTDAHLARTESDRALAQSLGGNVELIDTRLLFCTPSRICPMFVDDTPMKIDRSHISPEYGSLIAPAFAELLVGTSTFA